MSVFPVIILAAVVSADFKVPLPTGPQVAYQQTELIATIGLQMNTYTMNDGDPGCNPGNWNTGIKSSSPSSFAPTNLNMTQWAEVLVSYGAKSAWFNAKHGCGFLAWPTKTTLPDGKPYGYDVSNSPAVKGRDLIREFRDSMTSNGIKPGYYYSLKDNFYLNVYRNDAVRGASTWLPGMANVTQAQFNAILIAQLRELWTNYGEIFEVWFDGGVALQATTGKTAAAWKEEIKKMIHELIPNTVAFGDGSRDHITANPVKWVGTEEPTTEWQGYIKPLSLGAIWSNYENRPNGTLFMPKGCDATISTPHSFWYTKGMGIRPLSQMIEVYHLTVGNNCVLELGFAVLPSGELPQDQVVRAKEFGDWIRDCYSAPVGVTKGAAGNTTTSNYVLELTLGSVTEVDRVWIREDLAQGQRVVEYKVEAQVGGKWVPFPVAGLAVGNKHIDVAPSPIQAGAFRLTILKAVAPPIISSFGAFKPCPKA